MVQLLKFVNWQLVSSHTLQGMWLYISNVALKSIHICKRGSWHITGQNVMLHDTFLHWMGWVSISIIYQIFSFYVFVIQNYTTVFCILIVTLLLICKCNVCWQRYFEHQVWYWTLIARFMGPTWDPPGANRTQLGPMWETWKLLSGDFGTWGAFQKHLWALKSKSS